MSHATEQIVARAGVTAKPDPTTLPVVNHYVKRLLLKPKVSTYTEMAFSLTNTAIAALFTQFSMSGILELDHIEVVYRGTATGQFIAFGITPSGSGVSATNLSLTTAGHAFQVTNYNIGALTTFKLPVPGTLSDRLRGAPIRGMPLEFKLEASAAMVVAVVFHLRLHGPETSFQDFLC